MQISSDIIRGHLEVVILKLITEQDRYGYEIATEIYNRTDEKFSIKEATLYAMVQRLERKELITSYIGTKSKGSKRRYYKITTLGRAYYKEKRREWATLKTLMSRLLEETDERN